MKDTPPKTLSGPLDRLNAILSLLQPLDRYRATCAIGSAIGRALSRPNPRTGGSSQPPRSKPLRGLMKDTGYSSQNGVLDPPPRPLRWYVF